MYFFADRSNARMEVSASPCLGAPVTPMTTRVVIAHGNWQVSVLFRIGKKVGSEVAT